MTAGLPGTGIGGLFYLLLAMIMPLRGFSARLRKRGGWRVVARQLSLVGGMGLVFWTEGLLLKAFTAPQADSGLSTFAGQYAPVLTWTPWIVLATVIAAVQVMRAMMRAPHRKVSPPNTAPLPALGKAL